VVSSWVKLFEAVLYMSSLGATSHKLYTWLVQ
jgi:hypothetical protein